MQNLMGYNAMTHQCRFHFLHREHTRHPLEAGRIFQCVRQTSQLICAASRKVVTAHRQLAPLLHHSALGEIAGSRQRTTCGLLSASTREDEMRKQNKGRFLTTFAAAIVCAPAMAVDYSCAGPVTGVTVS